MMLAAIFLRIQNLGKYILAESSVDTRHCYPAPPERLWTVVGGTLLKPHAYGYYQLASYLRPINNLRAGDRLSRNPEVIQLLTYVKIGLLLFLVPDNKKYLPSAYDKADLMSRYIDEELMKMTDANWDEFLEEAKVNGLQVMLKSFETLLQNDLDNAPLYLCEDEVLGNLSIAKLSTGAHNGYPLHVRDVLPAPCKEEIDEAGKCLVFERPTASGFHILRAVEMMVKQYLSQIPHFTMPPLNRQNWGSYITLLGDNGASKVVTDTLRAIKDNHRNPLMHPEDSLTMPEAVSLFSICQSMTEALVTDLQNRKLI